MKMAHGLVLLVGILTASCGSKTGDIGLAREKTILTMENSFYDIYYAGNTEKALGALQDYIKYLAGYENDPLVRRVCSSGKSLALARIAVIEAHQGSPGVDMRAAVSAFKEFDQSVPKPTDSEIVHALAVLVVNQDKGRVPWVTDDAVQRLENGGH